MIFIKKNRELNLTTLAGFFAITLLKIIAANFRKMEKMRFDELYIYVDKSFLLQGDQKKHANWLFLGEIIQPNLPKFAHNLIRGQRVRI